MPRPGRETDVTQLPKGRRITGDSRAALGEELAARYRAGESIREIAASLGRSYGFVHAVLLDGGVVLRGRGGAVRRRADGGR
jgi:hypothetical protein